MKSRSVAFAKALRNIVAAPFLFGALTLAIALLTGVAIAADLLTINHILTNERAFLAAGGDLLRASVREQGVIDAAECAHVAQLNGVIAASAITPRQARISGRPDHTQTVLEASDGIETIVGGPKLGAGEAFASQVVAKRWDWQPGTRLKFVAETPVIGLPDDGEPWQPPSEVLTITATPDTTRLGDQAASAIFLPRAAIGTATECVVQVEPAAIATVEAALPALLGEDDGRLINVQRQIFTGEFGPDPAAEFTARPTRQVRLTVGAVIGLLLAFVAWSRRQRSALYATLGLNYASGFALRAIEAVYPALAGIAWGTVWATLVGVIAGLGPRVAVQTAILHALTAASIALAVILLVSLWRPPTLQALKDR